MKISIDTSSDSKDEIKMAIKLLSNIVNTDGNSKIEVDKPSVEETLSQGAFNMFNEDASMVSSNSDDENKVDENKADEKDGNEKSDNSDISIIPY